MDDLERSLTDLERRIAELSAALDSPQPAADTLDELSTRQQQAFEVFARALERCSTSKRAPFAPRIARLRRDLALLNDSSDRRRVEASERLNDVARARKALADVSGPRPEAPGGSCDIAG